MTVRLPAKDVIIVVNIFARMNSAILNPFPWILSDIIKDWMATTFMDRWLFGIVNVLMYASTLWVNLWVSLDIVRCLSHNRLWFYLMFNKSCINTNPGTFNQRTHVSHVVESWHALGIFAPMDGRTTSICMCDLLWKGSDDFNGRKLKVKCCINYNWC